MKEVIIVVSLFSLLILMSSFASALTLTVNHPSATEIKYNTTTIPVSLTANSRSLFYYSDSGNWRSLCTIKSLTCDKTIRAREGNNGISFKAVDSLGNVAPIKTVSFNVDSKKPIVTKTFPLQMKIVNGSLFSIEYSEENLEKITLFYDGDKIAPAKTCASGLKQQCNFTIDTANLSSYNDKVIDFWFLLSDGINTVVTKKTRILIDTKKPIISETHKINGKNVKFIIDVTEKNFAKMYYTDTNDCGLEYSPSKSLCGSLQNGRCVVTKSFCNGHHDIVITVEDKAGNSATLSKDLDIDI